MTKLYLLFITTYGCGLRLRLNFQFRMIHFLLDEKREYDPWESDFLILKKNPKFESQFLLFCHLNMITWILCIESHKLVYTSS